MLTVQFIRAYGDDAVFDCRSFGDRRQVDLHRRSEMEDVRTHYFDKGCVSGSEVRHPPTPAQLAQLHLYKSSKYTKPIQWCCGLSDRVDTVVKLRWCCGPDGQGQGLTYLQGRSGSVDPPPAPNSRHFADFSILRWFCFDSIRQGA
jgi:hypothetical protein